MVGWHHKLNGHEFEQTLGDTEGQGRLACCSPWVTESDMTERLSNNNYIRGFPSGSVVKTPPANEGDVGLVPGLRRPPRGGNVDPLQYSCLGNPMDRAAPWATVYGVTESDTTSTTMTTAGTLNL